MSIGNPGKAKAVQLSYAPCKRLLLANAQQLENGVNMLYTQWTCCDVDDTTVMSRPTPFEYYNSAYPHNR